MTSKRNNFLRNRHLQVFAFAFQNNSLERAVDWIFSHIDDLDAEAAMDISEGRSAAESISESVPVGPKVRNGPGSEFQAE